MQQNKAVSFLKKNWQYVVLGLFVIGLISFGISRILENSIDEIEFEKDVIEDLQEIRDGEIEILEKKLIEGDKKIKPAEATLEEKKRKVKRLRYATEEEISKARKDSLKFLALPMSGKAKLLTRLNDSLNN